MARTDERPFAPYETDWGAFAPLKLRARVVAEGVYAGLHRSVRKGSGVEFGGQRPYVPGDDLRFIDRRALLRHDRLMVREFETETDRALWLVVDATASMSYRGSGPGSKLAFASLLAAALAHVALRSGDPVGLVTIGGDSARALPASTGREAFDRIVWALSSTRAAGDLSASPRETERALVPVYERARRGSIVVLFSDLIDLPERTRAIYAGLASVGRRAFAAQVLDPDEALLPFSDQARFRALEGDVVVEADPKTARAAYLARLHEIEHAWRTELVSRGGALVTSTTQHDPVAVVRAITLAIRGLPHELGVKA